MGNFNIATTVISSPQRNEPLVQGSQQRFESVDCGSSRAFHDDYRSKIKLEHIWPNQAIQQSLHLPYILNANLRYPDQQRLFLNHYTIFDMSGFLSSEAERALQGDERNAQQLFNANAGYLYGGVEETPFVDDNSRWTHAHTAPNGLDFFHPAPSHGPPQSYGSSSYGGSSLQPNYDRRSPSPHPTDLNNYGFLNPDNRTWRCAYPGCASKALFVRPCDLRKHFNRHSKDYHCRHEGCPQASEGGFSSKKDRARHEAKHNPGVQCEWDGCERIFSRVDNMKDHVRRIHRKGN
jgi:hypothetical protein